jgi:hypothetical protein
LHPLKVYRIGAVREPYDLDDPLVVPHLLPHPPLGHRMLRADFRPQAECSYDHRSSVSGGDPNRGSADAYESLAGEHACACVPYRVDHPPRGRADDVDRGCAGVRVSSIRERGHAQRFWEEVDERICNDSYCSDARSCGLAQLTPP